MFEVESTPADNNVCGGHYSVKFFTWCGTLEIKTSNWKYHYSRCRGWVAFDWRRPIINAFIQISTKNTCSNICLGYICTLVAVRTTKVSFAQLPLPLMENANTNIPWTAEYRTNKTRTQKLGAQILKHVHKICSWSKIKPELLRTIQLTVYVPPNKGKTFFWFKYTGTW